MLERESKNSKREMGTVRVVGEMGGQLLAGGDNHHYHFPSASLLTQFFPSPNFRPTLSQNAPSSAFATVSRPTPFPQGTVSGGDLSLSPLFLLSLGLTVPFWGGNLVRKSDGQQRPLATGSHVTLSLQLLLIGVWAN